MIVVAWVVLALALMFGALDLLTWLLKREVWVVLYPDGEITRPMRLSEAEEARAIYGGLIMKAGTTPALLPKGLGKTQS